MLASKVELPPVRGAGYEPLIATLSESLREKSAFGGAVCGVVIAIEALLRLRRRGHNGTEDYHQNGYENHLNVRFLNLRLGALSILCCRQPEQQ